MYSYTLFIATALGNERIILKLIHMTQYRLLDCIIAFTVQYENAVCEIAPLVPDNLV